MENLSAASFKQRVFNYEKNHEWSYAGDLPAIVDFYADWCMPCKRLSPILEELSREYAGKVHIYKVDTEQEQELAGVFGIRSIPSLLFIPKDGPPQMVAGGLPRDVLIDAIKEVLKVPRPLIAK